MLSILCHSPLLRKPWRHFIDIHKQKRLPAYPDHSTFTISSHHLLVFALSSRSVFLSLSVHLSHPLYIRSVSVFIQINGFFLGFPLQCWLLGWFGSVESFQQVNTLYQPHGSTFPASTHFQGNPGSATLFLAAVADGSMCTWRAHFVKTTKTTNNTFKHFTIEFKVCACRPICLATRKCELSFVSLWVLSECLCVNVSCLSGCVCVLYVCMSLSLSSCLTPSM